MVVSISVKWLAVISQPSLDQWEISSLRGPSLILSYE